MKPAIIIVDMLKDNVDIESPFSMGEEGRKIIPRLQELLSIGREQGIPIIYACDSRLANDFIFQGRMKPHCIRGTTGEEVISELQPQNSDIIVPKRLFSAFFKTDLDITLRQLGIDTIVVGGIATEVCVIMTALDGIGNGFKTIILSDCCASYTEEIHHKTLSLYQKSPLRPLFKIMTLAEFISSLE